MSACSLSCAEGERLVVEEAWPSYSSQVAGLRLLGAIARRFTEARWSQGCDQAQERRRPGKGSRSDDVVVMAESGVVEGG